MTEASDVMCFSPDKDANAQQNKNYNWYATDRVFQGIVDGGFRPEIWLGMGWRNMNLWGRRTLNQLALTADVRFGRENKIYQRWSLKVGQVFFKNSILV